MLYVYVHIPSGKIVQSWHTLDSIVNNPPFIKTNIVREEWELIGTKEESEFIALNPFEQLLHAESI